MQIIISAVVCVLVSSGFLLLQNEGILVQSAETCDCSNVKDIVTDIVKKKIDDYQEHSIKMIIAAIKNVTAAFEEDERANALGMKAENAVESCKMLKQTDPKAASGMYWIKPAGTTSVTQLYCDMTRTCGGITGGWTRIANLDMTDTSQNCPPKFVLFTSPSTIPKRLCNNAVTSGCTETTYSVHGMQYNHVCGKVIGYQKGYPIAFHNSNQKTLNGAYIYGVSLTHARKSSHIWSFAGAPDDTNANYNFKCPCIRNGVIPNYVPSYVGNDYFCDTGIRDTHYSHITQIAVQVQAPLWDGKDCGAKSTCCTFPGGNSIPPWFYKQLSGSANDDIELRICNGDGSGYTPIEKVELYVQ